MTNTVQPTSDASQVLRTSKKLVRELRSVPDLRPIRLAILGGSTTQEVATFLEIFLLQKGLVPTIWQSEYGRYYEDSVIDSSHIGAFDPDLIYVHTTNRNIQQLPRISDDAAAIEALTAGEIQKLTQVWDALQRAKPCPVIQNNFEMPSLRNLGNVDSHNQKGATHFIQDLNRALSQEAQTRPGVIINDLNYVAAQVGLDRWYDSGRWFSYKLATSAEASMATAYSVATLIAARYGLSKKCLVLDLDNTLWGGVIGDDGADRIVIGRETARAEAFTFFQEYCRTLKDRGVVLAVCSKNTEEIAKTGFAHPDSILQLKDFACFKANWEPKHENIRAIAAELNLGLDSLVFVDDNPAERALVAAQLPMVAVPDVGDDVTEFPGILNRMRYFEPLSISEEDVRRAESYASKSQAAASQAAFSNYEEYLQFLQMTAEIEGFTPAYLDRITQLTNKTNQFNLTTKRYSIPEITAIASDPSYVTLYVKLADRFGEHGLISVVIGRREETTLHIDLWLMSCRVLKRDVELLVLDELVARARLMNVKTIKGYYLRTPKNDMVAGHYETLGFHPVSVEPERSEWELHTDTYESKNKNIATAAISQLV